MGKKDNKKAARNFNHVPRNAQRTITANNKNSKNAFLATSGIGNTLSREPIPHYNKAPNEDVRLATSVNARIVMGKDRGSKGTKYSGYGGKGDTECAVIDLVCGGGTTEQGTMEEHTFGTQPPIQQRVMMNPAFTPHISKGASAPVRIVQDAARIIIGEKGDPDEKFNFLPRKGGVPPSKAKSFAGLVADKAFIVGQEGVVITTKTTGYNSKGGRVSSTPGIDLVAGNRGKYLQPLVKGNNLTQCLSRILDEIRDLNQIVLGAVYEQMHMNHVFGNHFHPPPILFVNVLPEPFNMDIAFDTNSKLNNLTVQSLQNQADNVQRLEDQFCSTNGQTYVCSRYNKTN